MTNRGAAEVDDYLLTLNEEEQKGLLELRRTILAVSEEITEKIAWGLPTYYLKNQYLVQIGPVKYGLAFYTSPETKKAFEEQLKPYKQTSKNAVHFKQADELPLALITSMTQYRIREKSESDE